MSFKIKLHKLLFLTLLINNQSFGQTTSRPNILFIFADDLGYMDCGFTGSKTFETPHLDALAKKGMTFRNAYAGAGNCAPSRGCLLSGQYTPRHGIYAVGSTTRGPKEKMKVVPVRNTASLAPSFVTMAEALQKQGYKTGLFGKWHLGISPETQPEAQGFEVYFDSRKDNPNKKRDEPEDPKGIFSLTKAACDFMSNSKGKPFFAYLAHHAIHSTLEAKPATIERFKKKGLDNKTALYAACVYDFDASIGLIMDFLKKSGLDKNTLVVFTSDNGATQQSSQEPLRGNKGGYYEGGIREPFIAYFPERIKPNTVNETPIINLDLYPTFVTLAGGEADKKLDGESLLPLFFGTQTTTKRQNIFWHFPGYLDDPVIRGRDNDFRTRPVTAMRKGNWKIHVYHEEWVLNKGEARKEGIELYDLQNDEGERIDLSKSNPTKREELLKDVLAWWKKTSAKLPVPIDAQHTLKSDENEEGN